MPDHLDFLEAALDKKHAELKSSIQSLRAALAGFSLDPNPPKSSTPKPQPARGPRASGLTGRVREFVKATSGEFRLADVAAVIPDVDRMKLSNAITGLRVAGEVKIVKSGSGQYPSIYVKA